MTNSATNLGGLATLAELVAGVVGYQSAMPSPRSVPGADGALDVLESSVPWTFVAACAAPLGLGCFQALRALARLACPR